MTPGTIMFWCFLAVVITIAAAFAFAPRRREIKEDHDLDALTERLRENAKAIRESNAADALRKRDLASYGRRDYTFDRKPRDFGSRDKPYGSKRGLTERGPLRRNTITLTTRQMEHINIARRSQRKSPLNRNGFRAAIAQAGSRPMPTQPSSPTDWMTYLILWEVYAPQLTQTTAACSGNLIIDPNEPSFGHSDGHFSGAGASGSWDFSDATPARAMASAINNASVSLSAGDQPLAYGNYSNTDGPSGEVTSASVGSTSYASGGVDASANVVDSTPASAPASDSGGGGGD